MIFANLQLKVISSSRDQYFHCDYEQAVLLIVLHSVGDVIRQQMALTFHADYIHFELDLDDYGLQYLLD